MIKEWTEENILKQLKSDVEFGYEKAMDERGISSELMAMVVNTWCKVLENGLNLNGDDGWYHIDNSQPLQSITNGRLRGDKAWQKIWKT